MHWNQTQHSTFFVWVVITKETIHKWYLSNNYSSILIKSTDNNIGKKGRASFSEALKSNTTLTGLNLWFSLFFVSPFFYGNSICSIFINYCPHECDNILSINSVLFKHSLWNENSVTVPRIPCHIWGSMASEMRSKGELNRKGDLKDHIPINDIYALGILLFSLVKSMQNNTKHTLTCGNVCWWHHHLCWWTSSHRSSNGCHSVSHIIISMHQLAQQNIKPFLCEW